MFNDKNREDIANFFEQKIKENPLLSNYFNHYGFRALSSVIGYKVDKALQDMESILYEFYSPESERILLSKLMYEIGYIRFQQPLSIIANIQSDSNLLLYRGQKYTDGANLYIQKNDVQLYSKIPTDIELELGSMDIKHVKVDKHTLYYKIPLYKSYRELYKIEIFDKRDRELIYSQQFLKDKADYSLEIKLDGTMQIVVRLNNTNGLNIRYGDSLRVQIYTTTSIDEEPTSLQMIGSNANKVQVNYIIKKSNYKPYMTREEMKDILLYNKNINNSLIYNEDYRRYIISQVRDIEHIKVWHEQDEVKENGFNPCMTNGVFISYISADNKNLDREIISAINEAVYGKNVVIKRPIIQHIGIKIRLTNNIRRRIPLSTLTQIKSTLIGYYDDIYTPITKEVVYTQIKKAVENLNVDIDIEVSSKGVFKNAKFFFVEEEDINIDVIERF